MNQRTPASGKQLPGSGRAADKRPLSLAALCTTLLTPTPRPSQARRGWVAPRLADLGKLRKEGVRCAPKQLTVLGVEDKDPRRGGPELPGWDLLTSISRT